MNRSYSKIRHMQESNRILENRLINNKLLSEAGEVDKPMVDTFGVENLYNEFMAEPGANEIDVASCSIDDINLDGANEEENTLLQKIKAKVKELFNNKDKEGLKSFFNQIKDKLRSNKGGETTEQVETAAIAATTIMGITAPLAVWIAVGVVALALVIVVLVRLSSWIPRVSGKGCSKTKTFRVRVKR